MCIVPVLDRAGYKVELLDAFMTDSLFLKVGDSVEVGMPYGRIKEEIRRRKPEIVGIANPFSCEVENAIRVGNIVKEIDPSILTVVGGPHATAVPVAFLGEAKNVDIAVIGEGEYTMLDIAKCFGGYKKISDVQGIAYRKDDAVVQNSPRPFIKNLDELPYPAYHLVNMEQYLNPKKIEYPITT
jgi:anaerobic magnesium-protoporphyrin IX monomethyl ester cyclase